MKFSDLDVFKHPECFRSEKYDPDYALVICHALHHYYHYSCEDKSHEEKLVVIEEKFEDFYHKFKNLLSENEIRHKADFEKDRKKSEQTKKADCFEIKNLLALYPFEHHKDKEAFGILYIDKTKGIPPLVLYPDPTGQALTKSTSLFARGNRQKGFKSLGVLFPAACGVNIKNSIRASN